MAPNDQKPDFHLPAPFVAMAACLAMMAHHVGSKAVRDALYLTHFEVVTLPRMVIVAAIVSIVSVLGTSRAMSRWAPARLVPVSFLLSGVVQVAIWLLVDAFPRACAVAMYLQSVALGSLLTSGFWSMLNERFDPRTAKQLVGRIGAAGTLGGIIGGILAERIAAGFSLTSTIPVLAVYHFTCGLLLSGLSGSCPAKTDEKVSDPLSGWDLIKTAPYLRTMAALVVLGTMSAAMIDYVFKSQALGYYGRGENLLRFFALFYSVNGVLAFIMQTGLSGTSLHRLGMARTVGALPLAASIGGLGALIIPGLGSATVARALENIFRSSLFRAGYEVFYTPIPTQQKRAAKAWVDVGFDRLGDALGGGIVTVLLLVTPHFATYSVLTGAILCALAGLWVTSRLQGAYVDALERGLMERGEGLALDTVPDSIAATGFFDTAPLIAPTSVITRAQPSRGAAPPESKVESRSVTTKPPAEEGVGRTTMLSDPVMQQIAALRSGSATQVRQILENPASLRAYHVPHLIALLGWDRISNEVSDALRRLAERHYGQMLDALLDPQTDFSIRRRLPRVLLAVPTKPVAQGLLHGLNDKRFEVRYQCGRALAVLLETTPALRFETEEILGAVRREVAVSKPVWDSQRLLDRAEDTDSAPFVDEYLRNWLNRSLQHLFTLLSLVFPAEPLKIALHGLHAEDSQLRGTAIEYLDSILPQDVRMRLWPLIEKTIASEGERDARPRDEILADLLKSNHSIRLHLAELHKKQPPVT